MNLNPNRKVSSAGQLVVILTQIMSFIHQSIIVHYLRAIKILYQRTDSCYSIFYLIIDRMLESWLYVGEQKEIAGRGKGHGICIVCKACSINAIHD